MTQTLFVGGRSFSTAADPLRDLFAQIDGVQSVAIVASAPRGAGRGGYGPSRGRRW